MCSIALPCFVETLERDLSIDRAYGKKLTARPDAAYTVNFGQALDLPG
jgi:hypothetical protein